MATGVADCYYNVVDLPAGGAFRFRVACVNKAGQGPYSNLSEVVSLDISGMNFYALTDILKYICYKMNKYIDKMNSSSCTIYIGMYIKMI